MRRWVRAILGALLSLLGLGVAYLVGNWDSILQWLGNNVSQLPAIFSSAGSVVVGAGAAIGLYSKISQSGILKKARKVLGTRALYKSMVFHGYLLDRFSPEDVVAIMQRVDVLPLEMRKEVHDLAVKLGRAERPAPVPVVPLSPEEENRLWAEIKVLHQQFMERIDVHEAEKEVVKAQETQKKILAKFLAPIQKQHARKEERLAASQAARQQSKEKLHQLFLDRAPPQGE